MNSSRLTALSRLEKFVSNSAAGYAKARNFDLGPESREHTSVLSPYLRHRIITEEEVVSSVLQKHSFASVEKFIQEVVWRTYWKGWLEQRPAVWSNYLTKIEASDKTNIVYQQAIQGNSGIDCFDFWVGELKRDGYLHNHARMWFASIWIFTLELPWYLGAEFFLKHLLDGDPASNTLSWRWVAGLQTRGKNYVATAKNIKTFTDGRFNPVGELQEAAVAIDDFENFELQELKQYFPATELAKSKVIILHEEDVYLDLLVPDSSKTSFIVLRPSFIYGGDELSDRVLKFKNEALDQQVERLKSRSIYDVASETELSETLSTVTSGSISAIRPSVGPLAEAFKKVSTEIEAQNKKLLPYEREWDAQLYPHAKKGFFPFKKKVLPNLVKELID